MVHSPNIHHRYTILLFFLVFGLSMLGLYMYSTQDKVPQVTLPVSPATSLDSKKITDTSIYIDRIKNALIVVPETTTKISLVDGRGSYGTNLDGGDVTLVKILGGFEQGGVAFIYADMVVQSGGTGAFHYLVLFDVHDSKVNYRSAYFVGDRVALTKATATSFTASGYTVELEYLDRREGDAMVDEPTVQKVLSIPVKNGVFVQSDL